MSQRRVRRLVVGRPGKCLFPVSLRNVGGSYSLEGYPCAISPNATLARDGISQVEQITTPSKINGGANQQTHKGQNERSGEIDIRNHKAKCQPGPGERLYGKNCRNHLHRGLDEFVETVEDVAEHRFIIGGLQ